MENNFEFEIPNVRRKQIRLFENLILFLNGLSFILFGIKSNNKVATISGLIILLLTFIRFLVKNNKYNMALVVAMVCFASWITIGYWWIGILFLALSMLGSISSGNKKIKFDSRQIKLSNPFSKIFNWSQLQNVILKDGLLTMDFRNNKLLQTPIINQLSEAETKQFNDFCNQQLVTSN